MLLNAVHLYIGGVFVIKGVCMTLHTVTVYMYFPRLKGVCVFLM